MFEFGARGRGILSRRRLRAVSAAALAVVLVFVSVNQVLVRLWARASRVRSAGRRRLPPTNRLSDRAMPSAGMGSPTADRRGFRGAVNDFAGSARGAVA